MPFRSLTTRYITQTVHSKAMVEAMTESAWRYWGKWWHLSGKDESSPALNHEIQTHTFRILARSLTDWTILLSVRSHDRKILHLQFRFLLLLFSKEHVEGPYFFFSTILIYLLSFWWASVHVLHFYVLYPYIFFYPRAVVRGQCSLDCYFVWEGSRNDQFFSVPFPLIQCK
jgi:hypothetical protein